MANRKQPFEGICNGKYNNQQDFTNLNPVRENRKTSKNTDRTVPYRYSCSLAVCQKPGSLICKLILALFANSFSHIKFPSCNDKFWIVKIFLTNF